MPIDKVLVSFIAFVLNLVICLAQDGEHGTNSPTFTAETFSKEISKKPHFVMFFAPWCGHCKRLAPTWDELAKKYNKDLADSPVTIAKVDCTEEFALCSDNGITGYPTLKFFKTSSSEGVKYKGQRAVQEFEDFFKKQLEIKETEEESPAKAAEPGAVLVLKEDTFKNQIKEGYHFVKFYAPWCGHCQDLAPTWDELAKEYKDDKTVSIAKVDCTQEKTPCEDHNIGGYPTLILFKDGVRVDSHRGQRTIAMMKDFLKKMMKTEEGGDDKKDDKKDVPVPPADEAKEKKEEAGQTPVTVLSAANFEQQIADKTAFIKFYAPWCGHCKNMAATWEELAKKFSDNKAVEIAEVDCTKEGDFCGKKKVDGYPSLFLFQKGKFIEEYNGGRKIEDFQKYVNDHMPHDEL